MALNGRMIVNDGLDTMWKAGVIYSLKYFPEFACKD
jgi:hypothetical protein